MTISRFGFPFCLLTSIFALGISPTLAAAGDIDPLQLNFHREAARRFLLSQEISLGALVPTEVVALDSMHPTVQTGSGPAATYRPLAEGLEISAGSGGANSAIWVSGINPFATYIADIKALPIQGEVALEFATLDRKTGAAVVLSSTGKAFATLRIFRDGTIVKEQPFSSGAPIAPPFTLFVQMNGGALAAFARKDGMLQYLGALDPKGAFTSVIDFRDRETIAKTAFFLATKLPSGARVTIEGARSVLSSGIGQADIRPISYEDGSPLIDQNRLWFTFSSRGLGTEDAFQGVMSVDPSTFDPRFEGAIVFDRGDGVLRNDYASHVFYDRPTKQWRAITCCFSMAKEGRGTSGLALASSAHDPRRGFSVMAETLITPNILPGRHEDPSLLYDASARKWRLLTCSFQKEGIRAQMFESEKWDGPYKPIAGPVPYDSTGTQMVKIGSKTYVLSGAQTLPGEAKRGGVIAYSYPDLKMLGEVKYDLPASLKGGRIWPNVVPLPPGFPSRYIALPMDRANYPGVTKQNWSYGALYLFQAFTPDIGPTARYEY